MAKESVEEEEERFPKMSDNEFFKSILVSDKLYILINFSVSLVHIYGVIITCKGKVGLICHSCKVIIRDK